MNADDPKADFGRPVLICCSLPPVGCFDLGTRLLNRIPVNSVDVKVVDQNDQPIPGAQVEASPEQKNRQGEKCGTFND